MTTKRYPRSGDIIRTKSNVSLFADKKQLNNWVVVRQNEILVYLGEQSWCNLVPNQFIKVTNPILNYRRQRKYVTAFKFLYKEQVLLDTTWSSNDYRALLKNYMRSFCQCFEIVEDA